VAARQPVWRRQCQILSGACFVQGSLVGLQLGNEHLQLVVGKALSAPGDSLLRESALVWRTNRKNFRDDSRVSF